VWRTLSSMRRWRSICRSVCLVQSRPSMTVWLKKKDTLIQSHGWLTYSEVSGRAIPKSRWESNDAWQKGRREA